MQQGLLGETPAFTAGSNPILRLRWPEVQGKCRYRETGGKLKADRYLCSFVQSTKDYSEATARGKERSHMNVGDTVATGGAKCAMLQVMNEWVSRWTHRPHVYLFNTGIVPTKSGAGKVPLKCQDDEHDRKT
ncbi:hypothetical protein PISMIDRAFT_580582 [Pisolithus microcarpus 441]|uniref:Uncharacterized protein n=1 Tax=Pisolithus microcarpus 441 TaxID=765257 RepID=A0A0D0A1Q9_9AGAM|nr:hypothetical protein PISMIDRAFT_580582 [Pisolithus microcarpus 441]